MPLTDLTIEVFLILRHAFFGKNGAPKTFTLRDKRNTQDDPLDEYIAKVLSRQLKGIICQRSPGPLISPDFVIYRPDDCLGMPRSALQSDSTRIVAVEVKKLQRQKSGQVARSTGLDYNTTPPCGTVRVYDADDAPLDIRGFYLFACQEQTGKGTYFLSALALCDGNVINADFKLYLSSTGQRQKGIGLGTYGDGFNRQRPMMVFANPLGAAQLDHATTLVGDAPASEVDARLGLVYQIGRTIPEGGQGFFFAYRAPNDIPRGWEVQHLLDPFPKPLTRVATTQARGRFRLPLRLSEEK